VLSLLSFHKHSDPLGDFVFLLLSHRWRIKCLPGSPVAQATSC
jgi:hypothetical protein